MQPSGHNAFTHGQKEQVRRGAVTNGSFVSRVPLIVIPSFAFWSNDTSNAGGVTNSSARNSDC